MTASLYGSSRGSILSGSIVVGGGARGLLDGDGDTVDARAVPKAAVETVPAPDGEVFCGGGFQPGDVIKCVVVELRVDDHKDGIYLRGVDNPSVGIGVAGDFASEAVGVPVSAAALMARRCVRQVMRCLEGIGSCDFKHCAPRVKTWGTDAWATVPQELGTSVQIRRPRA